MTGYTIAPKPTEYRGTVFRSRLEATWAAFFDLLKWKWDYEPVDLNGWVPDFIIRGSYRELLVEVKPTPGHLDEAMAKIIKAAPGECILLLENGPISRHGTGDEVMDRGLSTTIGWAWSPFYEARGKNILPTFSLNENEKGGPWDAHVDGVEYLGFYTGTQTDIGAYPDGDDCPFSPYGDLRPLWAAATNTTRWKGPR